jgi:hypothetical protein
MAFPSIFHDDTFVAFCDISGFRQLMNRNSAKAIQSLQEFYAIAYDVLGKTREQPSSPIYGLLVSDCAILVAENRNGVENESAIRSLLQALKEINKRSLEHDIMLTTSIAFGPFHYEERAESFGIEKNMVTGAAYIKAFTDQSAGKPKLKCGECRIIIKNLPRDVIARLEDDGDATFQMLQKEKQHLYYYWMRQTPGDIEPFKNAYKNTEDLKFLGIRLLLSGAQNLEVRNR